MLNGFAGYLCLDLSMRGVRRAEEYSVIIELRNTNVADYLLIVRGAMADCETM